MIFLVTWEWKYYWYFRWGFGPQQVSSVQNGCQEPNNVTWRCRARVTWYGIDLTHLTGQISSLPRYLDCRFYCYQTDRVLTIITRKAEHKWAYNTHTNICIVNIKSHNVHARVYMSDEKTLESLRLLSLWRH